MQEGGVVNPELQASDSLSQQTLSASPLLPTEGSTDSDTPEGTFNFGLLSEDFQGSMGLEIPELQLPEIITNFQYRDEEGKIDFQKAFDAYALERKGDDPDDILSGFQSEIQTPVIQAAEAYDASIPEFNVRSNQYLQKMARMATPESLSNALKARDIQTGEYDLSKLQLNEQKDVQYKVPGIGMTNQAMIMADDLLDYSKYFEKGEDDKGRTISVLTEEGQRWMATEVDPKAMNLLKERQYSPETVSYTHLTLPTILLV